MKKTLIFLFVTAFTILFTTGAFAGWVRFDNFNSYRDIEEMKASSKWFISEDDEAIADFSIENGKLKIEHKAGNPDDSAWAQLTKMQEEILGICATITVKSWNGDVRVRIGADYGVSQKNSDYLLWYQMQLRHRWSEGLKKDLEYVAGNITALDMENDFEWLYDLFYTELGNGKKIITGVPYRIMAIWDKKRAQFRVIHPYGVGAVKFSLTEKIDKIDEPFRAIGTRSSDGPGTCVVYIDDVYVYIKGHRH